MNYFSKFEMNPQRRESRKLLANPQALHASILSLFPPNTENDTGRPLWRLDSDHPQHTLYVVSPRKPDFSHLIEHAGWENNPGQSIEYTKFLQRVEDGTEWFFKLQANPTKAIKDPDKPNVRGTIIPLVKEEQQIEWLLNRSANYGFSILPFPDESASGLNEEKILNLRVTENHEQVFYKSEGADNRRKVTLRRTIFEGRLRVTDAGTIRRTLVQGLGRAKSYGYGLLTLRS